VLDSIVMAYLSINTYFARHMHAQTKWPLGWDKSMPGLRDLAYLGTLSTRGTLWS
jgi:hypothetical protein